MILNDYVKAEQEDLKAFLKYWETQNKERPEQFPMEMNHGEWFEQYTAFCEIQLE